MTDFDETLYAQYTLSKDDVRSKKKSKKIQKFLIFAIVRLNFLGEKNNDVIKKIAKINCTKINFAEKSISWEKIIWQKKFIKIIKFLAFKNGKLFKLFNHFFTLLLIRIVEFV